MEAIRLDRNGAVDDVAITCDTFRLERMDERSWWACAYRGDARTTFHINAGIDGAITVDVDEDTIGCSDDTKGAQHGNS